MIWVYAFAVLSTEQAIAPFVNCYHNLRMKLPQWLLPTVWKPTLIGSIQVNRFGLELWSWSVGVNPLLPWKLHPKGKNSLGDQLSPISITVSLWAEGRERHWSVRHSFSSLNLEFWDSNLWQATSQVEKGRSNVCNACYHPKEVYNPYKTCNSYCHPSESTEDKETAFLKMRIDDSSETERNLIW